MPKQLTDVDRQNIIEGLSIGYPANKVAEMAGVSESSVVRTKAKSRGIIAKAQQRLVEAVPDLVEAELNIIKQVKAITDQPDSTLQLTERQELIAKLYPQTAKRVGQAVGILPTPTPSIFVQNLHIDARRQVISPSVMALLAQAGQAQGEDEDVLDIDHTICRDEPA